MERTGRSVAAHPVALGPELVSVTVFRLAKPFRPARWPGAVRELDRVAANLARRLGGEVSSRETVALAGRRGRRYELQYRSGSRDLGQRLVFLLVARREYQLLCRYPAPPPDEPAAACDRLRESFRLT